MGKIIRRVAYPMTPEAVVSFGETMSNVLAHRVSFGSTMTNVDTGNNMDVWKVANMATGVGANTEFAIAHNLRRVPIHFHGYAIDGGLVYANYPGMTAWTAATPAAIGHIYVKCTTTGNIFLMIY